MSTPVSTGVHQMPIETPFAVGTVNTYLIEGDPLTLVDCGPNTATALGEVERRLADAGHGVSDLELIFVTHQHLDHCPAWPACSPSARAPSWCASISSPPCWPTGRASPPPVTTRRAR